MDFITIAENFGFGGFVGWAVVERAFSLFHQQQDSGKKRVKGTFGLISVIWYGTMLFSFLDVWSLRWTLFRESFVPLRMIAMLFIVTGIAVRVLARTALGREYSVHVQTSDTHELVTRGVYKTVRHPAYQGLSCLFIGIPLSPGSRGGIAGAVLAGIPSVVYRIRIEEQALIEWFGNNYIDYKKHTKKMIPFLW